MGNVSGLEAAYRDYGPQGVNFFFIYKSLAHPELKGNYVQPFTLEERLAHARQAVKQLGATIPWLVDPIDNRLKHALGDRANSEFIIDPQGKIVRKRAWSDPAAVRKDLEELVGKLDAITKPEDLKLKVDATLTETAPRGVVETLSRGGMFPVVMDPKFEQGGEPFYAKLRAEVDLTLLDAGRGKLYLGFRLDPFYGVHWNNLNKPLRFELDLPEGALFSTAAGQAPPVDAASDCDPREFMIDVEQWPADKTVTLTVYYAACTEKDCRVVRQSYVLMRERDRDGGRAGPAGFRGAMTAEAMIEMLLSGDKNGDGKLSKQELPSLLQASFAESDQDGDGVLDEAELQALAAEHVSFLPRNR